MPDATERLITVPLGTEAARCRGCNAVIYWVKTPRGKNMPVDCNQETGIAPTRSSPGQGVPHWGTCPKAAEFHRRSR